METEKTTILFIVWIITAGALCYFMFLWNLNKRKVRTLKYFEGIFQDLENISMDKQLERVLGPEENPDKDFIQAVIKFFSLKITTLVWQAETLAQAIEPMAKVTMLIYDASTLCTTQAKEKIIKGILDNVILHTKNPIIKLLEQNLAESRYEALLGMYRGMKNPIKKTEAHKDWESILYHYLMSDANAFDGFKKRIEESLRMASTADLVKICQTIKSFDSLVAVYHREYINAEDKALALDELRSLFEKAQEDVMSRDTQKQEEAIALLGKFKHHNLIDLINLTPEERKLRIAS